MRRTPLTTTPRRYPTGRAPWLRQIEASGVVVAGRRAWNGLPSSMQQDIAYEQLLKSLLRPCRGAEYCDDRVCLSVSVTPELHVHQFLIPRKLSRGIM